MGERWPTFCGKKLDVKTLYDQVSIRRRGFENVKTNKQWKEIACAVDPSVATEGTSNAYALKCLYRKWVLPFEKKREKEEEEPTDEEKELIAAMLDLEFRCSRPAPKRPKLENGLEEIAEQLEIERMTAQTCKICGQSGR